MKHAEAARILDLADAPLRRSTPAVTLGLAILTIAGIFWFAAHEVSARGSLHSAHSAVSFTGGAKFGTSNSSRKSHQMKKYMAIGVVSTAISASAMAQNAVQWRVEDGGNGHWYQGVVLSSQAIPWQSARNAAESKNADLAMLHNQAASNWVFANVVSNPTLWVGWMGPWIGGYQVPGSSEPAGGWVWVDGSPVTIAWGGGQPDNATNCGGNNAWINYYSTRPPTNSLSDMNYDGITNCAPGHTGSAVFEWSADCNNDGIVDYGQIRAGEYADVNANNIPDCCEYSTPCDCDADIIQDNAINGVDLAAIMNAWGTDGGKIPRCDVDGSGIVDGSDLTIVLDAWGPCP